MNIVDVAIIVIILTIARNFMGIDPEVVDEVGMIEVDTCVEYRYCYFVITLRFCPCAKRAYVETIRVV